MHGVRLADGCPSFGRTPDTADAVHVGAVLDEQGAALAEVLARGHPQLLDEEVARRVEPVAEPRVPRPAAIGAEAVREQQPEVAVVAVEAAVVERLAVVRIPGVPAFEVQARRPQQLVGR
jgi:hypothetical protein